MLSWEPRRSFFFCAFYLSRLNFDGYMTCLCWIYKSGPLDTTNINLRIYYDLQFTTPLGWRRASLAPVGCGYIIISPGPEHAPWWMWIIYLESQEWSRLFRYRGAMLISGRLSKHPCVWQMGKRSGFYFGIIVASRLEANPLVQASSLTGQVKIKG